MNKTLVVVPTYNERENLPPLAKRLMGLPVAVDILAVDDNSPDGTGQIADELSRQNPSIHVLHRTEKSGLGRAYVAGFKWALDQGYEYVFELDGDFSHNPDDIPMFLEAAKDADLVLGSRYVNGIRIINWPLSRLMLSKCAAKYVRIITGMPFTDPTGGYKCFRRKSLQTIELDPVRSNGYSFQIEMTHRLWRRGMKIVEVPIIFTDRFQGHSKMSGHIIREAVVTAIRLWFQNKMRRRPACGHRPIQWRRLPAPLEGSTSSAFPPKSIFMVFRACDRQRFSQKKDMRPVRFWVWMAIGFAAWLASAADPPDSPPPVGDTNSPAVSQPVAKAGGPG